MEQATTIGLDIAKHVFQVHGADAAGHVLFRKRITRVKLLGFLAAQAPCVVAMEACAGAHYWAREIGKLGHHVRSSVHRVSKRHRVFACRRSILQRRQSEPGREIAPGGNPSAAGTSAVIAVEVIGPTPGIVINRRAVGSDFERWLISASNAAICASNAVKVSTSSLRMTRTLSGSEDCRSSTRATRVSTWVMPFGKT